MNIGRRRDDTVASMRSTPASDVTGRVAHSSGEAHKVPTTLVGRSATLDVARASMNRNIRLLDGGLSTALEQLGWSSDGPLWTGDILLHNPEAVTQAHRSFVDVGADIIITGSYQLSFEGGRRFGYSDHDIEQALRASTNAARQACDDGTLVAASIGPFGAHLNDGSEFTGYSGVTEGALRTFHERRLNVLLETGPDMLAIETIPEIGEAEIVLELLRAAAPTMPVWVSFTIAEPGRVSGGGSFDDACELVAHYASAVAVGINCSHPDVVIPTLHGVHTDLPFVVYPNSGRAWDAASMSWHGGDHASSSLDVREWVRLGARIVGGCCGYGPSDIAHIREQLG